MQSPKSFIFTNCLLRRISGAYFWVMFCILLTLEHLHYFANTYTSKLQWCTLCISGWTIPKNWDKCSWAASHVAHDVILSLSVDANLTKIRLHSTEVQWQVWSHAKVHSLPSPMSPAPVLIHDVTLMTSAVPYRFKPVKWWTSSKYPWHYFFGFLTLDLYVCITSPSHLTGCYAHTAVLLQPNNIIASAIDLKLSQLVCDVIHWLLFEIFAIGTLLHCHDIFMLNYHALSEVLVAIIHYTQDLLQSVQLFTSL